MTDSSFNYTNLTLEELRTLAASPQIGAIEAMPPAFRHLATSMGEVADLLTKAQADLPNWWKGQAADQAAAALGRAAAEAHEFHDSALGAATAVGRCATIVAEQQHQMMNVPELPEPGVTAIIERPKTPIEALEAARQDAAYQAAREQAVQVVNGIAAQYVETREHLATISTLRGEGFSIASTQAPALESPNNTTKRLANSKTIEGLDPSDLIASRKDTKPEGDFIPPGPGSHNMQDETYDAGYSDRESSAIRIDSQYSASLGKNQPASLPHSTALGFERKRYRVDMREEHQRLEPARKLSAELRDKAYDPDLQGASKDLPGKIKGLDASLPMSVFNPTTQNSGSDTSRNIEPSSISWKPTSGDSAHQLLGDETIQPATDNLDRPAALGPHNPELNPHAGYGTPHRKRLSALGDPQWRQVESRTNQSNFASEPRLRPTTEPTARTPDVNALRDSNSSMIPPYTGPASLRREGNSRSRRPGYLKERKSVWLTEDLAAPPDGIITPEWFER